MEWKMIEASGGKKLLPLCQGSMSPSVKPKTARCHVEYRERLADRLPVDQATSQMTKKDEVLCGINDD